VQIFEISFLASLSPLMCFYNIFLIKGLLDLLFTSPNLISIFFSQEAEVVHTEVVSHKDFGKKDLSEASSYDSDDESGGGGGPGGVQCQQN